MITIRPAASEESRFIAENVFRALLVDNPTTEQIDELSAICSRSDTLYSWKNTSIAEYDGQRAGILISYDGALYHQMREVTFPLFLHGSDFSDMDEEAKEGEWYADSLSVVPKYRHKGVGRALLKDMVRKRDDAGIRLSVLAVEPENPMARSLYESVGFKYEGEISLFGHTYLRMVSE